MSYTFEWVVPDRVLKVLLPVTFDDPVAIACDADIITHLESTSPPVHMIIDLRQVKIHPSMKTFFGWKHLKHPHLGQSMTIGMASNPVTRFLASLMTRVVGLRMKDSTSVEEALAYLATIDDQLANLR